MRRWAWWTIGIAVLLGVMIAALLTPILQAGPRLRGITSTTATQRQAAWKWFTTPPPGTSVPRLERWYPDIEARLIESDKRPAILDAIVVLESHDLLSWNRCRPELMIKCVAALRAEGGDHLLTAAELIAAAPDEAMLRMQAEQGTMRK